MIYVDASSAFVVARDLGKLSVKLSTRVLTTVRTYGFLLETQIKRNASTGHHAPGLPHIPGTGPGPNVATGDYRRSWHTEFNLSRLGAEAVVSTNAVQARALEFGRPQPYPHVGPAVDKIGPLFVAALDAIVKEAIIGA